MIGKNNIGIVADVFFDSPTKEFHIRELSRITGLSVFTIIGAIKTLLKKDFITVSRKGNLRIVRASHSVPFIRAKRARNLEKIYDSGLADYMKDLYDNPEAIILFGSYGRGMT